MLLKYIYEMQSYLGSLKTGLLDDAIQDFSLAYPSWAMSHYTMLYEYGKRTRDFFEAFLFF